MSQSDPYVDLAVRLGVITPEQLRAVVGAPPAGQPGKPLRDALLEAGVIDAAADARILSLLAGGTAAPPPVAPTMPEPESQPRTVAAGALPPHLARTVLVGAAAPTDGLIAAPAGEDLTLLAVGAPTSVGLSLGGEPEVDLPGRELSVTATGSKYQTFEVLGRGGMGEVTAAVDRDLRREVAIKTLHTHRAEHIHRFVEEAQVTGQLEHPNIVPVHDLGIRAEDRTPFIVMKRVRGRELATVLAQVRDGLPSGLGADEPGTRSGTRPGGSARTAASRAATRHRRGAGGSSNRRRAALGHGRVAQVAARMEPPDKALTRLLGVFMKVCDAIAYSHSRGVIHRDLKPANIMVGEFGEVLVMDWGLAKVVGRAEPHSRMRAGDAPRPIVTNRTAGDGSNVMRAIGPVNATQDADSESARTAPGSGSGGPIEHTVQGSVKGTPAYMSPEQASGDIDAIDEQSDVYALGAVLYEILTLCPPITDQNVYAVLAKAARGQIEPPSAASQAPWSIPRELEGAVQKAMATQKADRYRSADELRGEVEAFLGDRRLEAVEYSPLELLGKWARQHKLALTAAGGIAATVLVGIIGLLVVMAVASQGEVRAMQQADEALRAAENEQQDIARAEANALHSEGTADLALAGDTRIRLANQHDFFLARLPAVAKMGQALRRHPDSPLEWKSELSTLAGEMQAAAERVGNWALAMHIVELAHQWEAIDESERDEWMGRVVAAMNLQVERDRERLNRALDRLAEAEAAARGQGQSPGQFATPSFLPAIAPGTIEERARSLGATAKPQTIGLAMQSLLDDSAARDAGDEPLLSRRQRRLLIETVGRAGQHDLEVASRSVAQHVADALIDPPPWRTHEELDAWLWAAARLIAVPPHAFGDRTLRDIVPRATRAADPLLEPTLARAEDFLDFVLERGASLPRPTDTPDDPFTDSADYAELVEALGDYVASAVTNGAAYMETALALAEEGAVREDGTRLSVRQRAFVFDQLGLVGELDSTDGSGLGDDAIEDDGAVPMLRAELFALPEEWLGDRCPRGVDEVEWTDRHYLALAAARNLGRLDARGVARPLHRMRQGTGMGRVSRFFTRTALAFVLLPLADWPEPTTIDERVELAQALLYHDEDARALRLCEEVLADDPDHCDALVLRCEIELKRGDYERARDIGDQLVDALRDDPVGHFYRAQARTALGQFDEAVDDSDRAIELAESQLAPLSEIANIYLYRAIAEAGRGGFTEARSNAERAVASLPNSAFAQETLGTVQMMTFRTNEAEASFTRAIELDPTLFSAYAMRGFLRTGYFDRSVEALVDVNTSIRLNPDFATAYAYRAYARGNLGDAAGAHSDRAAAIDLEPNNWNVHMANAFAMEAIEDIEAARIDIDNAIALSPEGVHSILNMIRQRLYRRD